MNTKLAHIVMLDGDLTSPIMKNKKGDIGNIAAFRGEFPTPQHLYFTTDEPIQEGDWYKDKYSYIWLIKAGKKPITTAECKIIASTDPSLGLPAIPLTWIRDVYVPSNGSIKEVKLETGTITNTKNHFERYQVEFFKLTPNNEIVIVDEPIMLGENGKRITQHLKDKKVELQQRVDAKADSLNVDQELEDAAKTEYLKRFPYPTSDDSKQELECLSKQSGFKQGAVFGANWKAEQLSNHAIEFANWLLGEAYREWNKRASLPLEEAHKQLYELWQENQKKSNTL